MMKLSCQHPFKVSLYTSTILLDNWRDVRRLMACCAVKLPSFKEQMTHLIDMVLLKEHSSELSKKFKPH